MLVILHMGGSVSIGNPTQEVGSVSNPTHGKGVLVILHMGREC